jgi:hypothetical protein
VHLVTPTHGDNETEGIVAGLVELLYEFFSEGGCLITESRQDTLDMGIVAKDQLLSLFAEINGEEKLKVLSIVAKRILADAHLTPRKHPLGPR